MQKLSLSPLDMALRLARLFCLGHFVLVGHADHAKDSFVTLVQLSQPRRSRSSFLVFLQCGIVHSRCAGSHSR